MNNENKERVFDSDTDYEVLIEHLQSPNSSEAAAAAKELLSRSKKENGCLQYLDVFLDMLTSKNTFFRGRAIQLICAQARWDEDGWIGEHLHEILPLLRDEKQTAARQAIKAMYEIVQYQPQYADVILQELAFVDGQCYDGDSGVHVAEEAEKLRAVITGETPPPWQNNKGKGSSKPTPLSWLICLCVIWTVTAIFSFGLENDLLRYYLAEERYATVSTYSYDPDWDLPGQGGSTWDTIRWRSKGDDEWNRARVKTRDYMLFWVPLGGSTLLSCVLVKWLIQDSIALVQYKRKEEQAEWTDVP